MKKFLSLLLALLFCLSFIVSCEKEEEPSSSSEVPTSSGELSYDDRGLPIFPAPANAYTHYNVTEKENAPLAGEPYDTWVFDNYEAYCGFISQYAPIGDITEDMLDDSFIVVVYRREDIRWTENYSYHNFFKEGEKCSLILEYTDYGTEHTDDEYFFSFDIVLVPRSECDGSPLDITVSLKKHIHRWE